MSDTQPHESEQIRLTRQLVELAERRTEQSAERNYQNTERTLSVWIRTALALMVFGIAIDRLGLILNRLPGQSHHASVYPAGLSAICSIALVTLGVIVAVVSSARFYLYARTYARYYKIPPWHQPIIPSIFSILVAAFGFVLLVIMLYVISF